MDLTNTTTTPRLLEPGIRSYLPYGMERYQVPAMGTIVVTLTPDDTLTIRDPEGRQRGELVVFGEGGREDAESLGTKARKEASGLKSILSGKSESANKVLAGLKRRGLNLGKTKAVPLFSADSLPEEEVTFRASRDLTCVIAALGEDMTVEQQTSPTDLVAFIQRANPESSPTPDLPEPLFKPRLDIRVDSSTARAYEVKAGEFIQIMDVAGRQCSDFQAFKVSRLDKGIECRIDTTITRSQMRSAYPQPGLHSKFFDQDTDQLLEVIQDTVGQHDSFGLACAPKYYDDFGYFGHISCTENFNKNLSPYGIKEKIGWPAINFFFNTSLDAHHVIYSDESFSRAGDYVLLRALTDMVCVSSACPDDTTSVNAWNPTDIHVRVYPAKNVFSKAIATRMTPDADPKMTQETAFHPRTSKLTRNFVEYNGYWLPTCYRNGGAEEEYYACREKAVVMDLSPLRKFEILGPDAELLMQWVLTRNVRKLTVGQVVYSSICYPHGGMMDDGTLLRLAPDNFRWVGGSDYGGEWMRQQAKEKGYKVWVKSSTDQLHNIAVQGPKSRDILKKIIMTPPHQPTVEEIGWFRFTIGRIGGPKGIPVMISRTGYTGELGFEVWCHPKDAPAVWDAVWEEGQPHGMKPLGLDALDLVRIEAGLVFAGYEFCDQTDPFEAGVGFTVPLKTKEDDFVGKEALIRRKASPQRKLVGLELAGNEIGSHADCVHTSGGRARVGIITSGMRSPILKKNIALCRMDVAHAEIGTEVEIGKLDGQQKRIPAKVVPFPFYDPEKLKPRS
jgi:aminomethyltransferase